MLWLLLLLIFVILYTGILEKFACVIVLSEEKIQSRVGVDLAHTGFPKKRPFLKIENISNLITDYKKGKIIENIKASFMGNAVSDE